MSDRIELTEAWVDLERGEVHTDGQKVALRGKELALLSFLTRNPRRVITRSELFVRVWGYAPHSQSRTLDTTVRRLRNKIELDTKNPRHLTTVYGEGYRWIPAAIHYPAAATGHPNNLAPHFDESIGLDEQLPDLARALQSAALITLVGPPGVGKTRLAWELGLRLVRQRSVWFVRLGEVIDVSGLLAAVAEVLDIRLGDAAEEAQIEQMTRVLADRTPALWILDSTESLDASATQLIATWAKRVLPGGILVTSRRLLDIGPEVSWPVHPLTTRRGIDLFKSRATKVERSFSAAQSTVETLVRELDGLPLALELAAYQVAVMGAEELVSRLGDRARILRKPGVDGPHGGLEVALETSWQLLEAPARTALTQLSVFAGSFDATLAEEVVLVPGHDALELLHVLRAHSLVHRDAVTQQLMLLSCIRDFARRRLKSPVAVLERHAHTVTRRALPCLDPLFGVTTVDGLQTLRALRDDLIVATKRDPRAGLILAWTDAHRFPWPTAARWLPTRFDDPADEAHRRIALARLDAERPLSERLELLDGAVTLAPGPDVEVTAAGERIATLTIAGEIDRAAAVPRPLRFKDASPWSRAYFLNSRAMLHRRKLETQPAVEASTAAVKLFSQAPAPLLEARVVTVHAETLWHASRTDECRVAFRRVVALGERSRSSHTHCSGLVGLMLEAMERRFGREATQYGEQILRLARRQGDRVMLITALGNVSIVRREVEDHIAALDGFAEAIGIARGLSLQWHEAILQSNRGTTLRDSGDLDRAASAIAQAIALTDGNVPWRAQFVGKLGTLAHLRGEKEQARQCYLEALELRDAPKHLESGRLYALLALLADNAEKSREWARKAADVPVLDATVHEVLNLARVVSDPDDEQRWLRRARERGQGELSPLEAFSEVRFALRALVATGRLSHRVTFEVYSAP